MDRPSIEAKVEELARLAAAAVRGVVGDDARVFWFGSWVSGTAVERSDIDLAVESGRQLTGTEREQIADALAKLDTLRKFDVLDLESVSVERKHEIVSAGREL